MQGWKNHQILEHLFSTGQVNLRRGPLFDSGPQPIGPGVDFGRIEGMMLGLAIGDALGNTSEGLLPQERRQKYGEVRDYIPHPRVGGQVGLPSDDTQLAFWTLEQLVADGGFNPERLAGRFCRDRIFGIGSTVREFIRNYKAGQPWHQCGPRSGGNGALMRIAPIIIPHLRSATPDLWRDTALAAMLTHNDSASTAACLAFVNILWSLLDMDGPPDPEWWLDSFVAAAKDLENDDSYRPRGGALVEYQGTLWRFVEEQVEAAFRGGLPVAEACDRWYSGAFLLETMPSVIYILMRHGDDPEEAIVRAVNDTKDNDTIAAIVGAAVGALHGKKGIPGRWLSQLTGRTREDDDGRVLVLLEEARRAFWEAG